MKKIIDVIQNVFLKTKRIPYFFKENAIPFFDKVKNYSTKVINENPSTILLILISSVFINILEEWMLRKDFLQAVSLIFTSPIMFCYNTLIILATFSLIFLVKKRFFVYFVVSFIWYAIAFVSFCCMSYRTTPFNASDFRVIQSALSIIPVYFSKIQIISLIVAIIAIIALGIYIFIKSPRSCANRCKSAFITVIVCFVATISTFINTSANLDTTHFSNLPTAFRKYGFSFCFLCSILDSGIDKPDDYSIEAVKNIVDKTKVDLDEEISENQSDKVNLPDIDKNKVELKEGEYPNIIFLQLESFYDVNNIEGYTFSENPIPYFTALKENLPGAKFTVPSIGAGTANTEFEVLTGMEVSFFGIAEYPYLSVLQKSTCESICYNTKDLGYTSHAIHNHKGTFYDRNKVFPNLGFDTFTSLENMPEIVKNKRNWAKDSMLTDEIIRALDYTPDSQDLIYTISVQPHGRYPGSWKSYNKLLEGSQPHITMSGNDDNPENPGINYYINELHEVDKFLEVLINKLTERAEPVVLIMFGDHLPAFTVNNWTLKEGDYYQTDYVVWNNCGYDFSDAFDLTSYQLASYIFKKIGITNGNMNKLNQKYAGTQIDYSKERQMLEYDMLYGNKIALEDSYDYTPTQNIKFGLAPITLSSVTVFDGKCYVTGNNFNQYSHIRINGDVIDTSSTNNDEVLIIDKVPEIGDFITVVQRAGNHTLLGQSTNYVIFSENMIIQTPPEFILNSEESSAPQEYSDLDTMSGMQDTESTEDGLLVTDTPIEVSDDISNKEIESLDAVK